MADFDSSSDEPFFAAIGRLTISWAHLEAGLDFCVAIAYHSLDGDQIEQEIPRALKRKINFLRKAFKRLNALAPYRDRFLTLADQIETESDKRHDIIHGFIVSHESQEVRMIRLRYTPEMHHEKKVTATTASILKNTVDATKLASQLLDLTAELLPLVQPKM